MGLVIKPSNLYFKYRRNKEMRDLPKFSGKPDRIVFDRDDLYEVIPMFEAVMNNIDCCDGNILNRLEEIVAEEMPRFISSREDVYDYLVATIREDLGLPDA